MLDSGIELDLDRVVQNIDEADVITLYFPLLGKTLILDTRQNDHAGPLVTLVPIAQDGLERYRSFRRLRPTFPRPQSISMIPWTHRVDSLSRLGVWTHVISRVQGLASDPCQFLEMADACLRELRSLEVRELLRAVSGEQYETLWASNSRETN
ncbi:MAG: hypothetical protein DWG79_00235 [Chloroflexi bacterium]|nr:hypothetical protein [Chloroflexota bacterium]MDA1146415.1 hypothetical protein [Chloroflexota bacterium]MQC82286.1 hypothetical protein [Chloroflexota bacterium]MQC82655.1 hypothetical protein [Chloroflexota bacterium]PKB56719.1 MAG: hypothetical protein BZY69_00280 [SAR202 cluster bacterium Casp-Chloro-G1]